MVEQFICFGTSLAYRNSINEEPRNGLKKENARYHSVRNRLPSSFLSENIKINTILHNAHQHNYCIIEGNYIGDMFRLLISHLQVCFLSTESQDAMRTLGSHRVYICGIHKN